MIFASVQWLLQRVHESYALYRLFCALAFGVIASMFVCLFVDLFVRYTEIFCVSFVITAAVSWWTFGDEDSSPTR